MFDNLRMQKYIYNFAGKIPSHYRMQHHHIVKPLQIKIYGQYSNIIICHTSG